MVPNELLETTEFKTFISNFNSFPLSERHNQNQKNIPSTSASSKETAHCNINSEAPEKGLHQKATTNGTPGKINKKNSRNTAH